MKPGTWLDENFTEVKGKLATLRGRVICSTGATSAVSATARPAVRLQVPAKVVRASRSFPFATPSPPLQRDGPFLLPTTSRCDCQ